MLGSMLLMAQQPDDTMKQIDLLGRLLMPLALRLQELIAGRAVIDAQWLKAGLAVITLPVVVWAGGQFYRGAWSGFKHRTADMNALILLGRLLEARAKGRTSEAIRRLAGLRAKTAHVIREGRELEIAVEAVVPGDLVVVKRG